MVILFKVVCVHRAPTRRRRPAPGKNGKANHSGTVGLFLTQHKLTFKDRAIRQKENAHLHWSYSKRTDGRIAVTLDNNVWNFFHDRGIDLAGELPRERFAIFITREVEIETLAIPEATKAALKQFIVRTIADCGITTTWVFGFDSGAPGPQRYGGFDQGVWQSQTEREFYDAIR